MATINEADAMDWAIKKFIISWDGHSVRVQHTITKDQLDGCIERLMHLRSEVFGGDVKRIIRMECEPAIIGARS
jgi:hypothetical protein